MMVTKSPIFGLLALLLGLTASTGATQPAPARTFERPEQLTVGYLPFLVMPQFAAARDKGWLNELGTKIREIRFTTGGQIAQAFAGGQLDAAWIGSGPAINMAHQGVPAKVVAAVNRDTIAIVAHNDFAELYEKDPSAAAFRAYQERYGRKLRIGTAPTGTTVDIFMRLWLNKLGVDPERDVQILAMAAGVTPAAAIAKQIDATVTVEHFITLMPRVFPSRVIAWGQDVRPGQPNHVLVVHQRMMDNYPEFVKKLVELHLRATRALREDKDYWAKVASDWVGAELLPLDVARQAVRSPAANLIANPRLIVDGIRTEDRFLVSLGRWPGPATMEQIFDFRFYDAVVREHPELGGL